MSDGTDRKPVVPLARPGRLRPSWRRRLARQAVVVGLCVAILGQYSDIAHREPDCATAVHNRSAIAVQICQFEFQRTQGPRTGVHLAEAMKASGDVAGAKRVVSPLVATSARSDALYLLGQIASDEGRLEDATTMLEEARRLHRTQQRWRELTLDDGWLASVRTDRSEFVEALRLIDECVTNAQLDGDASLKCYCHAVAARTLIGAGYFSAAEHEIEITEPLIASDYGRINLEYQRGNFEQESGHHATAIVHFKKALALEARKRSPDIIWTIITELNLAYSLAEHGETDEALHHLKEAAFRDVDHNKEPEWTWTAAQIAYRRHDLVLATTLSERYFRLLGMLRPLRLLGGDDSVDRDDQIKVATLQARIELERNDLDRAEYWGRRAVKQAELVRSAQSALELRPWVLERWRAPHELLFTALARSGQIEAAAMAFDAWQGRTVQDALARPRPPALLDHRAITAEVNRLSRWLPVASQATFARSPDREAVLGTMRGIDLLALIVVDGDVWSLTANHGPPRLSRIATLDEIQYLVADFRGDPLDVKPASAKPASALGALLLPDESFRATRDVLHVLVDGRLKGLPVAALRRGANALIEMRPVVRVLRLPETRCVHAARSGHATVLADPSGDLPDARTEAEQVAGLLRTTSVTGAAATKAALFAAANDAVLHIAAHHQDLSYDEASAIAGDNAGTLQQRVARAIPALRRCVDARLHVETRR